MSWSFSGFIGPTFRKQSFENFLRLISYLPSASFVWPMEVWLWPGW